MINKILFSRENIFMNYVWDENNLLFSSQDKTTKLMELKKE